MPALQQPGYADNGEHKGNVGEAKNGNGQIAVCIIRSQASLLFSRQAVSLPGSWLI
jgi:hypothetical protein